MGKHFWSKHVDDELEDKQPGCVWGVVHALDYHHWHSNARKMIHLRKYEGRRQSKFSAAYGSSETKLFESGEVENLLNHQDSKFITAKRSRSSTNRRSLKARVKALVAQENSKEKENGLHKAGFSSPSRLQRTYSIHHLESADGGLHKILTDRKRPIIFLPENDTTQSSDTSKNAASDQPEVYNDESMNGTEHELEEGAGVLEMYKVDKDLFVKTVNGSDKSDEEFSDSLLESNRTVKLSKSKSFPAADLLQRRILKPSKLEHKKNEIWSFSEGDKFRAFNQSPQLAHAGNDVFRGRDETIASCTDENNIRKSTRIHHRSSSLNESLDKYASLFASSYGAEVKLRPSRSLKSINEYGHAPKHFRRIRSLSQVDDYYSDHKFGVVGNDFSADGSKMNAEESSSFGAGGNAPPLDANETTKGQEEIVNEHICVQRIEGKASLRLKVRHEDEDSCVLNGNAEEMDSHGEQATDFLEIIPEKLPEERHFSESDVVSSVESSFNSTLNLDKSGYADTNNKYFGHGKSQKETDPDFYYVTRILEKSGIIENGFDITWHSSESDNPLSPELFEEVEAYWNHEESQLTGSPDFYGCWHHRLLFDLVNEVLLEIYDKSSPYYPKPLSSNCHVRPIPDGNRFTEQVCTSIGALLNFKPEEKQTLDSIVAYDLANDCSWMNLQLESETVALDLEEMIFDELLEEAMCP